MFVRTTVRSPRPLLALLVATVVGAAVVPAGPPAHAQQPARIDSSLSLVPADAAFYITSLRNKEQLDRFYKSNAYKALRSIPFVKDGWKSATDFLGKDDGPLAQFQQLRKTKHGKEIIDLVGDAASNEIFIYGGPGFNDLLTVYNEMSAAQYSSLVEMLRNPLGGGLAGQRAQFRSLVKNRNKIKAPDLVIGFKLSQPKKAVAHLDELHKHLAKHIEDVPELKGRLRREKAAGGDFIVLHLAGSMLPENEIADFFKVFEEKEGEFKPLIAHLKQLTLAVSVGVKNGYLLVGLTSSVKDLEKFGGRGRSLAGRPEMKPLARFAAHKITGISYTSKALLESAAGSQYNVDSMIFAAKEALNSLDNVKEARKKAIKKDLDALAKELKGHTPEVGAQMAFTFLTNDGSETYSYDHGKHDELKGVRLDLHHHFGGNPILAAAFAFNVDAKEVAEAIQAMKTVYGHAEAIFLDMADDNAKDMYKKFMQGLTPILRRMEDTTVKVLAPSMQRSGLGLVIDGKWSSKQWVKAMPPMDRPLPMLELGLLVGTTDGDKFATAMKEYRTAINDFWAKVRELAPPGADVPEFRIPTPKSEKVKGGTLYSWDLPADAGLDKQVRPTAGAAKDVAVLALSKSHAQRLMARTPLKVQGGPLARKDLVAAGYLDWPALVDAAVPFVEAIFMVRFEAAGAGAEQANKQAKAENEKVMKQVREFARVLKAFQGISSGSYLEGGVLVTHTQTRFKDLPAVAEPK